MLESLDIRPQIAARIRHSPVGSAVDEYLAQLANDGYSKLGIRRHLQAVDRFGCWLAGQHLKLSDVDERTVGRFVAEVERLSSARPRDGRTPAAASGARRFVRHLAEKGIVAPHFPEPSPIGIEQWLESYDEHLCRVNGLTSGTRLHYLRYARRFAQQHFRSDALTWSTVTAADISGFVQAQVGRLIPSGCRGPVTAVRAMLRFLVAKGAISAGLEGAVPIVRQWKLASLPLHLTPEQLAHVLDQCPRDTVIGLRDRAILLLLARLGTRASEVARLTFDDFNWHEGHVRIRGAKTGNERALPISNEVGNALTEYLQARGPRADIRAVFLRELPPRNRALSPCAVTCLADRALRRARIEVKRSGSHIFRHTAATQMVRRGATYKHVADVLGHALLETTAIYAKLDVETLARVALPWPGGDR
jgi:site-specific recombinase XerD